MRKISASRMSMFIKCGLQYKYREIDGLIRPPGMAARTGTAVHVAIEKDLRSKMDSGELLPSEAVADFARDALTNVLASEGVMLTPEEEAAKDKTFGQAADQSVKCAIEYHEQLAPRIHPIDLEKAWGAKLNDGWRLTGHIDVVELNRIRDTKTRANAGKEMRQSDKEQLLTYAAGLYVNEGKLVDEALVDIIPRLKRKEATVTTFRTKVTKEAITAQMLHADQVTKAIDAGIFMPSDPEHWICSAKFCGYYDKCPHGRAKRIQG